MGGDVNEDSLRILRLALKSRLSLVASFSTAENSSPGVGKLFSRRAGVTNFKF